MVLLLRNQSKGLQTTGKKQIKMEMLILQLLFKHN